MIPARLALQQRVFAAYRRAFFEQLALSATGGFGLFAGDAKAAEHIAQAECLTNGTFVNGENRHYGAGKFYFLRQPGLRAWLKQFKPDVLIVEANARYLSTPAAIRQVHYQGGKVIGWGLGSPEVRGPGSRLLLNARSRLHDSLDAIITYSSQGAQEYISAGFASERVFIAPNAAVPRPDQAPPNREAAYQEGKPTLLFVGRLQERKRVDLLIKACARLPETLQPELWIVGDGPERADLEGFARKQYPSTRFTGALYGEQLAEVFRQADLFILPGTGGLSLQEAMSHGLPVMAAEGDGTQKDLVRDSNGWLLKPGSLDDLTDKLTEALTDPAALRAKGRASFAIVRDEVNIGNMVAVFEQAVRYVLGLPA